MEELKERLIAGCDTAGEATLELQDSASQKRRKMAKSTVRTAVHDLLEGLPANFLTQGLTEQEADDFKRALYDAASMQRVGFLIADIARIRAQGIVHKTLQHLDGHCSDRLWLCSKCGHRWGRHAAHTLACPNMRGASVVGL